MLTRVRWFIYGVVATVAASVLVVSRVRAMRERLDARSVASASVTVAADGLAYVGRRLQRSALRVAPDGSHGAHG